MVHTILALRIDKTVTGQSDTRRVRQTRWAGHEIPTHPAFRAHPDFPALLTMMFEDAILANDLQAHNVTAVSDASRSVHLVDLVHLVYLVGLVQPNKQDKLNKRDRPADFFSILLKMDSRARTSR
jgi:hypothetical protein